MVESSIFGPFYWEQIRKQLEEKGYKYDPDTDTFLDIKIFDQSKEAKKKKKRIKELEEICRQKGLIL